MSTINLFNVSFFLLIAIFTSILSVFTGAIISFYRYAEYRNVSLLIIAILFLLALIVGSVFIIASYFAIVIVVLSLLFLFMGYLTVYKKREIK